MPLPGVVTFGETLMRLTAPGRTRLMQAPCFDACFGGAEANVAVALAHLGLESRHVTVLPRNALGDAALAELRRHGVDTTAILRGEGRLGLYFLEQGAGVRGAQVTYDRAGSAFAQLMPDATDWDAALRGAAWLHLSGVTLAVSPQAEAAARNAAETAMALGVQVSFDCNFRPQLWQARGGDPRPVIDWFLDHADLAFATHRDLALLEGGGADHPTPASTADLFFARYPRLRWIAATVREVETHDRHALTGSLAAREKGVTIGHRWMLDPVIDRIGGGDAFAAGILFALLTSLSGQDAVDFATALAGLKHGLPGDAATFGVDEVARALGGSPDVSR